MIKWKDTTVGGYKILWREEIKEGERKGWSFGRIEDTDNESPLYIIWREDGIEADGYTSLDLVPAEPKIIHAEFFTVESPYSHLNIPIRVNHYDNGTYTVSKEEV